MALAWLAAAFLTGVAAGATVHVPAPYALAAGAVLATLSIAPLPGRYRHLPPLLLACFAIGAGRFALTRVPFGPHDLAYYNGNNVTLAGIVTAEPDVRDRGINYVVTADKLLVAGRTLGIQGQVEVHTPVSQDFDEGDRLQLSGSLVTPVNTASVPYRDVLAHRGIYSQMSFPRAILIGHTSLGLISLAEQLRQAIVVALGHALPEPESTLLIAILIGGRTAQLGTLAPILIATGLIHLIAVSGVKIAIVAGIINTAIRRALPRFPTLVLSTLLLTSYWFVSGATVAGLRASIMWLLVFVAAYLGRPTHALVSLGLAASIMVGVNPLLLWDTGFQLTTLATASIVAFGPVLQRVVQRVPPAIAASITTTTAAQIGVLPVQAASFHVLSPVSILTNALVLPLIPLTMISGFVAALYPHGPLVAIAYALVHAIVLIARQAANVPLASVPAQAFPLPYVAAYYALLLVAARGAWRFTFEARRQAHGEYAIALGVCALALGTLLLPNSHVPDRLVMVANGAALVRVHGSGILIDGGASPSAVLDGLGKEMPFPQRRLDLVIDTTPLAANVGSLLDVAKHYDIGTILDAGIEYPSHTYSRWRTWLDVHSHSPLALRAGVVVRDGALTIRVLSPDAEYPNPHDGAGVLLITAGRERILYLGPASQREQEDLPFRADVRAGTIISPVPVAATLLAASGARHQVQPTAGISLTLP